MNKKLILLFLFFTIIQIPLIFYSNLPADEWVYFAVSREVSGGGNLYSQIFFSHPPLQIYLYSLLIDLFGMQVWILKSFTLLISLGITYFIYLICTEKYGERVGIVASFIFLASYDMLIFSSFAFGIEISIFFFLASYYFLNKKNGLSGALFALCIMSRLHIAFLGIILFLYCKEKLKFLSGVAISIVYYLPLVFTPNFLSSILGYHISKEFFFGGWISYFKSSIHLWVLFFFSLKKLKDIKLIFIGSTYLLFLLLVKSTFEYYFLLVTVILCIEGSNCLIHSKNKKMLWLLVFVFIFLLVFRATPFLIDQTKGYNELTDYINTLEDKPLVGQSAITSLLALKTNRNISKLQIDTNFQRNAVYDYSNAIVIYNKDVFTGYLFNCSLIREFIVEKKTYRIWDC